MLLYIKCEARPVAAVVAAARKDAVSVGRRTAGVEVIATTINSAAGAAGR